MTDKYPKLANVFIDGIPDLFRTALSATADGVVITDREGNIKWVNPAYEKLTGYSFSEVLGRNPRILKSGKQNPAFYKELWDLIISGKVWHGELWNKRKDGSIYLEEQSITPVVDENENLTHFIAIKRDITQQHQLQEQLNQAKRIEAIGQLTAGVAHNFNNKLASILGFTELAVDDAEQYSNEDLNDNLNEILIASKSARDLVKQMVAFSSDELGELIACDINFVIKQVVKLISSTTSSAVRVSMNLNDVPQVMFDSVCLHQMLMSLTANSVQAMSGHGELSINTEVKKIEHAECNSCHQSISGDFVSVSIHDNGAGISPDILSKIFMPFFTSHQNTGGTGMGLSALHGMLHEMQGHVVVESAPGQGTTFSLLFPVIDSEIENNDSNLESELEKIKNIMVVDDEESVAGFLSEILEINGYQVTSETNSKEALKKISDNPEIFDLIITDRSMPQLSGIELAKLVSGIRKDLPVILITGEQVDKQSKDFDSIDEILIKPFETKELLMKIRNL